MHLGAHFYFSTGAFFIASVDPPFKESTDPGLMKNEHPKIASSTAGSKYSCMHEVYKPRTMVTKS